MSIYLNYNSDGTQTFTLTLSEKSLLTSTGETYEIYFTNEQSGNEYHSTFEDISIYPERYNKFNITTLIGDTSSGNIPFPVDGWYKYEAYTSTNKESLLEMGKCYIKGENNNTYTYEKEEKTYIYKK